MSRWHEDFLNVRDMAAVKRAKTERECRESHFPIEINGDQERQRTKPKEDRLPPVENDCPAFIVVARKEFACVLV